MFYGCRHHGWRYWEWSEPDYSWRHGNRSSSARDAEYVRWLEEEHAKLEQRVRRLETEMEQLRQQAGSPKA